MLKMILMTHLAFNPVSDSLNDVPYEFRNYDVIVRSEEECLRMGAAALSLSKYLAIHDSKITSPVIHAKAYCTDKEILLDFWPIPEKGHVPIPIMLMERL